MTTQASSTPLSTQAPSTPPLTQALPSLPSLSSLPSLPIQALQPQAQQPQVLLTQVPIMADYAIGVKKVPFDGTQENFDLWTTQLLGPIIVNKLCLENLWFLHLLMYLTQPRQMKKNC
jgi:hypothetical protein